MTTMSDMANATDEAPPARRGWAPGFTLIELLVVMVILGLIAGVGTALLLGRTVAGFMYGISPTDPLTITAVGAGLVVVAILASMVPAHRATRVDPVVALRAE